MAEIPQTTRLRYLKAKTPDALVQFLAGLPRIQIYGAPVWDGDSWFLWFVPNDNGPDMKSMDLTDL